MRFMALMLIGLLMSPQILWAQADLSGKVTNQKNGNPLSRAEISLKNSYQGTITNSDGYFELKGLPKEEQTLVVDYLGFEAKTLSVNPSERDELRIALKPKAFMQDEVLVKGTRASRGTPTTSTQVDKATIEAENNAKNMPLILSDQPSVVSESDDGVGVGYSDIRIRGVSQSRINVTINGIPLNDAESQGVFWVNIPDIAASAENIQIQRGVGTSTNGAGAFGSTINIKTATLDKEPSATLKNSFGSFNTLKNNVKFNTGLINDKWNFQGSFSRIESDGFIDRASSDLQSYYFSGGYYGENTIVKAIAFGGREETYQAWLGVPESKMGDFPESQQFLGDLAKPTEDLLGNEPDIDEGDRTFNPYTYENQVDDYGQDHYQLHFSQDLSDGLNINAALHYTYGRGYYEQYRDDASLKAHQIQPVTLGDSTVGNSDLVRRRWLDNNFYGGTFSAHYDEVTDLNLTVGGAWNRYEGDHFGRLKWARFAGNSDIDHQFYDNVGKKTDFNVYAKANYQLTNSLSTFVDIQYRQVDYEAEGLDIDQSQIDVSDNLNFFNPKVGFRLDLNSRNSLSAFAGIANREPTRNDYIDAPQGDKPQPERLYNLELGYEHKGQNQKLQVNGYFMGYENQLVQTGELNDVGSDIRTNVDQSYRAGIELIGAYRFSPQWVWNANLTVSRNRILNMDYKVGGELVEEFDETPIAFSPPVIGASTVKFSPFELFDISLRTKYVGKQYLDNTGSANKQIDPYLLNNLQLTYSTSELDLFQEITARVSVNNLLDVQYAADGYTFSYRSRENNDVVTQNYFYPQAGRHYMGTLTFNF